MVKRRRITTKRRIGLTLGTLLAAVALAAAVAYADVVHNDVATDLSGAKIVTVTAGGSGASVGYWITIQPAASDGQGGCNASDGSAATVTPTGLPTGVSKSPASRTFTNCGMDFKQSIAITAAASTTPGDYEIGATVSDSGTGSYHTPPAHFTLRVLPPPNTAPTLNLPADLIVEGNTLGGANVSYSVTATDAEDDPDPTPSCSPASGSFFALGGPHTVSCTVTDSGGLSNSGSFTITVVDTTPPALSLPANITTYATGNSSATVTYTASASDIVWGPVTPTCALASGSSFGVGTTTVNCSATDGSGNVGNGSFTVTVLYNFTGFFQPIDNNGVYNIVKAGSAIPVKFSLSGNQGLAIFAANSPQSAKIPCNANAPQDAIEETVTAGGSSLTYDALADQYVYVWKTDKAWATTCRQLQVKLADGSTARTANFNFTR